MPTVGLGLARGVFALLLVLTTVVLLLPPDQMTARGPDDKVGHVLTFAVLAVAGSLARYPVRWLLPGLLAYAAATELLQAALPVGRHGDLLDLAADAAGVLVGLALAHVATRRGRG